MGTLTLIAPCNSGSLSTTCLSLFSLSALERASARPICTPGLCCTCSSMLRLVVHRKISLAQCCMYWSMERPVCTAKTALVLSQYTRTRFPDQSCPQTLMATTMFSSSRWAMGCPTPRTVGGRPPSNIGLLCKPRSPPDTRRVREFPGTGYRLFASSAPRCSAAGGLRRIVYLVWTRARRTWIPSLAIHAGWRACYW